MMQDYKRARPFFYGDYYALPNNSLSPIDWTAYQLDRPDLEEGIVMAFKRLQSPFTEARFVLKGLDEKARYQFENADDGKKIPVEGKAIASRGFAIKMQKSPKASYGITRSLNNPAMNNRSNPRRRFLSSLGSAALIFLAPFPGKSESPIKIWNQGDPTDCDFAPLGEYIKDHTFVYTDGWWHLFSISGTKGYYHGYNGNEETFSCSISKNLVDWEFRGHVIHPSLRANTFDQHEVWAPFCIKSGNTFFMFYTGVVHPHRPMEYRRLGSKSEWIGEGHKETQGLATSTDLTDWLKTDDPEKGLGIPGRDTYVVRDEKNNRWLLYSTGGSWEKNGIRMHEVLVSQSADLLNWKFMGTCALIPRLDVNRNYGPTVDNWEGFRQSAGTSESMVVIRHPVSDQWLLMGNWQYALSDDPLNFMNSEINYYDNRHNGRRVDLGFACEIIQHQEKWYRSAVIGNTDQWRLALTEIEWVKEGAFRIVKPGKINTLF